MADAWDICPRGDWMWWALKKIIKIPKNKSVKFAKFCASNAKKYSSAAASDAYYGAYATDAYAYASDAYAYASDASYGVGANATDAAAYASVAAIAAASYSTSYSASYSASDAERQIQADWIRDNIKNPFTTKKNKA